MGSIKILQRIVCYVDSFIRNLKIEKYLRPILKSLSPVEGEDTLTAIIRTIQSVDFQVELRKLEQKQEIVIQSSISS